VDRLPSLVTVDPADLARFRLRSPDRIEAYLERSLGFWKLYDLSYRLQSALFGTSTRNYLYLHKTELVRRAVGLPVQDDPAPVTAAAAESAAATIVVTARRSGSSPDRRRQQVLAGSYPFEWDFAEVVRSHNKRGVFIEMNRISPEIRDEDRADLNAAFAPAITFVKISVPPALLLDGGHLSPLGSAAVARALVTEAPPVVPATHR